MSIHKWGKADTECALAFFDNHKNVYTLENSRAAWEDCAQELIRCFPHLSNITGLKKKVRERMRHFHRSYGNGKGAFPDELFNSGRQAFGKLADSATSGLREQV